MASELQSYRATGPFYFFLQKKVTELQSYRATGHISRESWLQSYRATGLRDPFIFFLPEKKLQSYRVTGLQSTSPGSHGFRATELQGYGTLLFFFQEKKVTELQSYRATGHLSLESWLQSHRATGLRDPFIFFSPEKKLQSYRVTGLQATSPWSHGFRATELQRYETLIFLFSKKKKLHPFIFFR